MTPCSLVYYLPLSPFRFIDWLLFPCVATSGWVLGPSLLLLCSLRGWYSCLWFQLSRCQPSSGNQPTHPTAYLTFLFGCFLGILISVCIKTPHFLYLFPYQGEWPHHPACWASQKHVCVCESSLCQVLIIPPLTLLSLSTFFPSHHHYCHLQLPALPGHPLLSSQCDCLKMPLRSCHNWASFVSLPISLRSLLLFFHFPSIKS